MKNMFTIKQLLACAGLVCFLGSCSTDDADAVVPVNPSTVSTKTKFPIHADDDLSSMVQMTKTKFPIHADDDLSSMVVGD